MSKLPIRADLNSGVVLYASHFPGHGTPPGWELTVVHLATNRLVERRETLLDDEFALALALNRRIAKYNDLDDDAVAALVAALGTDCEYDGCERVNAKCPAHHRSVAAPALAICDSCSRPCVGWIRIVGKTRWCWPCHKASPNLKPTDVVPQIRTVDVPGTVESTPSEKVIGEMEALARGEDERPSFEAELGDFASSLGGEG